MKYLKKYKIFDSMWGDEGDPQYDSIVSTLNDILVDLTDMGLLCKVYPHYSENVIHVEIKCSSPIHTIGFSTIGETYERMRNFMEGWDTTVVKAQGDFGGSKRDITKNPYSQGAYLFEIRFSKSKLLESIRSLSDSNIKDIFEVFDDLSYEDINIECDIYDDKRPGCGQIRVVFNCLGNSKCRYEDEKKSITKEMYVDLYNVLSPKIDLLKSYGVSTSGVFYFLNVDKAILAAEPLKQYKNMVSEIPEDIKSMWIVFNVNRER